MIPDEYVQIFLDEANEKLEEVEQNLPKMKESSDSIAILRRSVHTIKGSAAMLGFLNLSKLLKCMEFTFKKAIDENFVINENILDLIKESLKAVNDELIYIKETHKEGIDPSKLILRYNFLD